MNWHIWKAAIGAVFVLLPYTPVMNAEEVYKEYFAYQPIDFAKGFRGDTSWSGTLEYWEDDEAVERHMHFIGDLDQEWKLNMTYMNGDRLDWHEGNLAIEEGEELLQELKQRDSRFAACLSGGNSELRGIAAHYPQFHPQLNTVMTIDAMVEYCASSILEAAIPQGSMDNVRITAYIKSLSNGIPLQIDLNSEPMLQAYQRGERLFFRKTGKFNYACASCHSPLGMMGKSIRGEVPTTPFGDAVHFPAYRYPRFVVESQHERFRMCNFTAGTFPLPHGDPAYVDMEVFLAALSNGYPISLPAAR